MMVLCAVTKKAMIESINLTILGGSNSKKVISVQYSIIAFITFITFLKPTYPILLCATTTRTKTKEYNTNI